ncbi:hypothetical protein KIN20_002846 [Parelaphostrongylus tenuis]|uniref:Uncharacterized protein n=1 Tax=Parelaphostrongylus tenuis TaxID=148309 RepID=A0AAD5MP38_PARTN|nr:hypothetical protein KIN20_002846 [Parelaphostrongylus tenuis]
MSKILKCTSDSHFSYKGANSFEFLTHSYGIRRRDEEASNILSGCLKRGFEIVDGKFGRIMVRQFQSLSKKPYGSNHLLSFGTLFREKILIGTNIIMANWSRQM